MRNIFFCLIACWFTVNAQSKELALVVDSWPPYHFKQSDGSIGGFATEVMREVLENMGHTYTIEIQPFPRVQLNVKKGVVDGSFTATVNEERKTYSYFPEEPITTSKWVFFINNKDKNRLKLDSYEDLKGHKVGVVRGYTYTDEFWEFLKENQIKYATVNKDEQIFKMLAKKRIDYAPGAVKNSMQLLKENNLETEIIPLHSFTMKEAGLYAIWSKKRVAATFVKQFSRALRKFKTSVKYKEIYSRYFGVPPE